MTVGNAILLCCVEWIVVAAISARPRGARVALVVAVLMLSLPFFVRTSALGRLAFSSALVWCVMRTTDLAFDPPLEGVLRRLAHLFSFVDSRLMIRQKSHVDWRSLGRLAGALSLGAAAVVALRLSTDFPLSVRYAVRWSAGGLALFVCLQSAGALIGVISAASGVWAPPLNDAPYSSRSLSEFWSRRWNLSMNRIIRSRAFSPLARRSPRLALWASFVLSAAVHAYAIGAALGAVAALSWALFFLVQPLALFAERGVGVRGWPPVAGRAWTLTVLIALCPLMVEPALWLVEGSGR